MSADFTTTETLPLITKQTITWPRVPIAQLILIKGPAHLDIQKLYQFKKSTILGRKNSADILIHDPKLSRLHAQIYYDGRYYFIKDLNSSNGTRVNGKYITEKRIFPKDIIEIGDIGFEFNFSSFWPTMVEKREEKNLSPRFLTTFNILKIISMIALFVSSLILIYFAATYSPSKKRTPQSFKKQAVSSRAIKADLPKTDLFDRAEIYFEMANQAYQEGDYDKAKYYLIEANQIHPQDRFGRLELAAEEALMLKSIYHEKLSAEKEEEKTEREIDAFLKTAEKYIKNKEWDLATITYQEILLLDDDNEMAKRGIFNVEQTRYEQPIKKRKIKTPASEETDSFTREDSEKEDPRFRGDDVNLRGDDVEIEILWQETEELSKIQDYVEAKKKLEEILALDPHYKPASEKRAAINSLLGHQARMIYSQAVIFESLPDIEAAKIQWKKIVSMLSPAHPYHKKAAKKLSQYATY